MREVRRVVCAECGDEVGRDPGKFLPRQVIEESQNRAITAMERHRAVMGHTMYRIEECYELDREAGNDA